MNPDHKKISPLIFLDIDGVLITHESIFVYSNNRIFSPIALRLKR